MDSKLARWARPFGLWRRKSRTREGSTGKSGAIPYRRNGHGVEVLMVTSRGSGRWIVPKGNVEPHLSALESARLEVLEEAGVEGEIDPVPLGIYRHGGRRGDKVELFLMHVETVHDDWPEDHERHREWVSLREARKRADDAGLKHLIGVAAELLI